MAKQNVAAGLQKLRLLEQGDHHDGVNVKEEETRQHGQQSFERAVGRGRGRRGVHGGDVHACSFFCDLSHLLKHDIVLKLG